MNHKYILILILFCISTFCLNSFSDSNKEIVNDKYIQSIHEQATFLSEYIQKNSTKKYNDSIAILINMKANSGQFRFFVYDLKQKKILEKGLVTHGSGTEKNKNPELYFSNEPKSLCTSLGKYKIGKSYHGDFGKAYKMYGLETTNNKAFERFIVFHAHECVPDFPVENSICLSWGCPTVSHNFFQTVATYIDNSKRPILMEIFYR